MFQLCVDTAGLFVPGTLSHVLFLLFLPVMYCSNYHKNTELQETNISQKSYGEIIGQKLHGEIIKHLETNIKV